jgi:hypothetical protein
MAAATGYSLIGPTAPSTGVASAPYTVTLTPSGGTSASVTITPASTGNGTFTPASVALSTAAPSASFTYTPADPVGGAATISATNSLTLINPTALTLTIEPGAGAMAPLAGDAANPLRGLGLVATPGTNLRILHTALHLPAPLASGTLTIKQVAGSTAALLSIPALLVDVGAVQPDGSYTAKALFVLSVANTTALPAGSAFEFGVSLTTTTGDVLETCLNGTITSLSGGPLG